MKNIIVLCFVMLYTSFSIQAQTYAPITAVAFAGKKQAIFDIRVKYDAGCTLNQKQKTESERNKWIGGWFQFGPTVSSIAVRNSQNVEPGYNTGTWKLSGDVLTITGNNGLTMIFKVLPRDNSNHIVLLRKDGCASVYYYISDNDNLLGYHLYYNATTKDNFTVSQAATEYKASDNAAYSYIRMEGKILLRTAPGTTPLKVFYSEERKDYVTCAHATTIRDVTNAGYKSAAGYNTGGIEGYVYTTQVSGTVPLKLFYSDTRKEHFTTCTATGEQGALGAGYRLVRIEGYVYP